MIVSSQIGHPSKSKDFIKTGYNGFSYRKREFVQLSSFERTEDVFDVYSAYIFSIITYGHTVF